MELKIGISSWGYNERRNFIDLPYLTTIRFIRKFDLNKPYNYILFKTKNKINPNKNYYFHDYFLNQNIHLFHFFGSIYKGNKAWVVTSDVILPRWTKNQITAYRLLSKRNCKKIIFTSQIVYERQLSELNKYPEFKRKIESKMIVLPPSQRSIITSYSEKPLGNKILFTLVGHRILGKGGLEIVQALEELWKNHPVFELHIVSKLHTVDYLKNEKTEERLLSLKDKIKNNRDFIHHYESLSNDEVISLLKKTHVGLLPSYDDSFGYFVLEAQACGCPVITTDIMAFPEINNSQKGWIIQVPKISFGRPDALSLEKYLAFSEILLNNLKLIFRNIVESPDQIRSKGELALDDIKQKYTPSHNANYLSDLYFQIQSGNY